MFWRMPQRDVVSWSIMIKACTQHEHGNEALELFHQMQLEDVQPDNITFISVLDACTDLAALNEGHEVHCAIVDKGYQQDVVLETALINMYGKCGRLDNAKIVFGAMHRQDVVSWSAMIGACAQNEHGEEALELFHQMNLEGIEPNKVTFICVLDACASLANLRGGQEIHAAIINSGHECDVAVGTALINMYGKCKGFDYALSMFSRMPQQDVVSCSTMITTCAQNAHGKEALELFHQMWLQGFEPNIVTFICILDVCALFAAGEDGHHIHAAIVVCGCEQDIAVGNALLNMYGKCGNLDGARKVFHKMPQPDVVSWTAIIMAYAHNGHGKAALELFRLMHLEHVMPDKITFICVLGACTGSTDLDAGREIHAAIIENGYEQEVAVGTALIDMYGRCWSLDDARNVPSRMPQQDVACWSAMITACAQNGHSKEALELFHQMQLEGMKLDKVSFLCVLDACATLAGLEEGQAIHAAIMDNGFEVDAVVGNALVSMYGKCGSLDNARIVFDTLPQRDVVSWSALITACAENGHGKEAMQHFHQMQHEGIEPNKISFMGVLTACNHMGSVENGRHFFNSMKDHRIVPTVEHHLCMIDLLGRAGHLDEAEGLVDSATCRKVAMAWVSLLAACRIHGDVKRGARAASYCFELDPLNPTPYVILSNIYAAAGRWEDVANVRVALKNVSVNQQEGHSCLGVSQSVHEFVACDL